MGIGGGHFWTTDNIGSKSPQRFISTPDRCIRLNDAPSAKKNAQRERDKAEAARIAAAEASMADAYDDNY